MYDDKEDDSDEYKGSGKAEPSAKKSLEGKLGDIDKLVMLLLSMKQNTPPSPMGGPMAGINPSPSLPPMGPPAPPMGASMPPPPPMGAGGMPPMGGPMGMMGPMGALQQQLQSARGLV